MSNELFEKQISRRSLVKGAAAVAAVGAAMPITSRYAGAADNLKIAFSVPGLNFPFFVHMMDLAEAHAKEIGGIDFIRLDGQENGKPSSTKQSSDLEAMIAQKINGLVISPNDVNALAPAIQAVIDAGIPVVTVDRNVTGATTLAHVGADNVKGGEAQGSYLVQILTGGGDIFELEGQPGASPAIDRHKGLHNILDKQSTIKIVQDQTANFARADALTVTESMLSANPSPKAIVCANDDMAFGVVEAIAGANLSIPVIGFDALPEALVAIRDGKMAATVEQFPGGQAAGALDLLIAKLRDKKDPAQHDTFLIPILISKENLDKAERAVEAGVASGGGTPVATPAT
ncbi:MAG: substrate-binding domain-containing protein [Thermomicrobiales bacterium]